MIEANLRLIPPERRAAAREALARRDADAFLFTADDNMVHPVLVLDNLALLKRHGIYERALLTALTMPRVNLRHVPLDLLYYMLGAADRTKLRSAGDPLPEPGPFNLYRGVAGHGRARRVRGISWTASREKATWFARRFHLPKPAVFQVKVEEDAVLAYDNGRGEEEFVLLPDTLRPTRLEAI